MLKMGGWSRVELLSICGVPATRWNRLRFTTAGAVRRWVSWTLPLHTRGGACGCAWRAGGADELVFLDITASHEGRGLMLDIARRVAETVFIPFTVGGGLSSLADIQAIISTGADKVSINTAAVRTPSLITEGAEAFGSQA